MDGETQLGRFNEAQEKIYNQALSEIRTGRKRTHWIWYIFPQIQGLGLSETSRYYAIKDFKEAEAFLRDPVLGGRLIEICRVLLEQPTNQANEIFGSPDDMKLKSSMTLFASLRNTHPVFKLVLDKFFNGKSDLKTLELLGLTSLPGPLTR